MAEINTKYFGKIPYAEQDCITFPDGLFGFEQEHNFLLIHFSDEDDSTFCMQSLKDENLAFVVINPFLYIPEYTPILSETDRKMLNVQEDNKLTFYVICVMKDTIEESTANLKCPLAINAQNHLARQVILENSSYTFRHSFQSFTANTTKG